MDVAVSSANRSRISRIIPDVISKPLGVRQEHMLLRSAKKITDICRN